MRMLCTIVGLAVGLSMSGSALAQKAPGNVKLSQAQCLSLWKKVNASGAPTIDASQAQGYVTNFTAADPDNDGTLTQTEFQTACAKGMVQDSSSAGAASGSEGTDAGMPPAESPMPPTKKQF